MPWASWPTRAPRVASAVEGDASTDGPPVVQSTALTVNTMAGLCVLTHLETSLYIPGPSKGCPVWKPFSAVWGSPLDTPWRVLVVDRPVSRCVCIGRTHFFRF